MINRIRNRHFFLLDVALLWLASVTMSLVTAPEPRHVLLVPIGGMAVMLAWMLRVLLRGDVRRFYAARAAATSASAGDFPLPR